MPLPKYLKIFDIRTQEMTDRETGNTVKKAKVVFNSGIEITYNGEKVDLGQYKGGFLNKAADVIAGLNRAVESGALDEAYAQKQVDFLEEKNVSSVFEFNTQPKKAK